MFDWSSISSPVRNEGVLKCERVQERNEGVGKGEQLYTGRACNSFEDGRLEKINSSL